MQKSAKNIWGKKMNQKKFDKQLEKSLIETFALNWGVSKRAARECLFMFRKQKTK